MSPRGKRGADTPFLSRTEVAAEKTAAEIQGLLGRAGARRVMTDYVGGEAVAISFTILIEDSEVLFRLPVRWENYFKVMQRACAKSSRRADPTEEQAKRTAWRVAKAWLEAQLALVESEMAAIQEVMLPYVVQANDKTLYERLAESGFKLIEYKKG